MNAVAPLKRAVKSTLTAISRWRVPCVEPIILKTLPHDTRAFTQGMAFHKGQLYESTGGETNSSIRRLDAESGGVEQLVPIPNDFAEGVAAIGDRLYQLSWTSGKARVFSVPDLRIVATHSYVGEGWGLAAAGDRLVSSDGSSVLRYWTPQFEMIGNLRIVSNGVPIRWLNDLEYVDGKIYANVVASPFIIEVDASTGHVRRLIDCRNLVDLASPTGDSHVLNGIAYSPERNVFFVTGKNWRSLFVVDIPH